MPYSAVSKGATGTATRPGSGGFFAHNYPEYIVGVAIGRTLTEAYLLGDELANA